MDGIVAADWYRSAQTREVADLAKPESLMLLSMRWWVRCYSQQECALERLIQGMSRGGAPDAAYSVNGLMWVSFYSLEIPRQSERNSRQERFSLNGYNPQTRAALRPLAEVPGVF